MLPNPFPVSPAEPTTAAVRGKFAVTLLNATACYLLAYELVRLAQQSSLARAARHHHVPGTWHAAGVHFNLSDSGWSRELVLAVYGAGPLAVLGLGMLALVAFWGRQRQRRGLAKLLLLWLLMHALNQLLGGLLADTITQSGSWFVPNWLLGVGTWPSLALGLLLGAGQLGLGMLLAQWFLQAQDSRTVLRFAYRARLVRYAILGPWLAGSAVLALSQLPDLSLNEGLHLLTMGLLLGPLALGVRQEHFSESQVLPAPTRPAWGLLALAVLGLLAWRWALSGAGLRLG